MQSSCRKSPRRWSPLPWMTWTMTSESHQPWKESRPHRSAPGHPLGAPALTQDGGTPLEGQLFWTDKAVTTAPGLLLSRWWECTGRPHPHSSRMLRLKG